MIIIEFVLFVLNGFHVQLLIAGFLFWRHLKLRINRAIAITLLGTYCVIPFVFLLPGYFPTFLQHIDIGIWGQSYYLIAIAYGALLWLCFKFSNIQHFLFFYIPAIIIQHGLYDVNSIIDQLCSALPELASNALHLMVMILLYAAVHFFFIWRLPKENGFDAPRSGYLILFTFFAAFLVYGLSVWTRANEPFTYGAYLFDLICCVLTLVVHFGKFNQSKLEREKELILQILQGERDKHQLSTQTIEMINRKSHDLKYQIASLKKMSKTEQLASISELESAVNFYDNTLKTNNETLDVLLYERSLFWEKFGINFSCIADGAKLNFMKPEDIYSLFGNALDNAIESVQSIKDTNKRIISLNIAMKGNILVITVSNYYNQDLLFDDGLPITTKPDKEYHGFGIKSIRYIAEKYGGTISIQPQNGIFKLIVMMPVQTRKD